MWKFWWTGTKVLAHCVKTLGHEAVGGTGIQTTNPVIHNIINTILFSNQVLCFPFAQVQMYTHIRNTTTNIQKNI